MVWGESSFRAPRPSIRKVKLLVPGHVILGCGGGARGEAAPAPQPSINMHYADRAVPGDHVLRKTLLLVGEGGAKPPSNQKDVF